ncbi:MAG: type II toxin-antitoxin system HicA family toxin [Rhodobacter sp.]|nr:type II toxin-antitoxin system HicA family toxin [Rhodobacter sp.]
MPDYYRDVTRLLASAGFIRIAGGKGSHEKWRSDALERLLIVPRKLKSRHTANAILKSAQIGKKL